MPSALPWGWAATVQLLADHASPPLLCKTGLGGHSLTRRRRASEPTAADRTWRHSARCGARRPVSTAAMMSF